MGKISRKRKGTFRKYDTAKITKEGDLEEKKDFNINAIKGKPPPAILLGGGTKTAQASPADLEVAMAKVSQFLETVQEGKREILRQNVISNLNYIERQKHNEVKEAENLENKDDFDEVLRAIEGHIGYTRPEESDYAFQYDEPEEEIQNESENDKDSDDPLYVNEDLGTVGQNIEEIPLEEDEELQYEDFVAYSTFGRTNNVISTMGNKLAIACFYMNALNAPPPELWKGKTGVINRILDVFQIRNRGYYIWVRDILQAVRECIVLDKEYVGQGPTKRRGKAHLLSTHSDEAKILAATMEKGLGIRHATWRVNTYRDRQGLEVVGQTCVFGLFQRLKPTFTAVGKMKTGSNDKTSNWAVCRLKWATQFLIMLGEYKTLEEFGLDRNNPPPYFDPTKLPKISLNQIA